MTRAGRASGPRSGVRLTMADVTTRTTATPGLLDEVRAQWAARGWDPATLDTFRMEGEGGDGGGGEGGDAGGQGGAPASSPPPAPPPAPTGADLTALQGQIDAAKAAGGADALKPFMALVGASTEAELKTRLEEWKQADEANKSEAQRAIEARQEAERQAQEANGGKTAAEVALLKTHALMRHGITDADQINGLLDLVKIDGDPSAETAMAAVENVKATFPALFTPATPDPGKPPAPHTPPPRPAGGGTPPATGVDAGRERAKAEKQRRQTFTKDDLVSAFAPRSSPFAN